ncbi:hypothetical protein HK097_011141 [Rhizophlyctis rosea]|uniref:Glycine-rich protein n=1 Tax=Rhizophlyctis rosea TaxID=64517 RepID=A0AAD5X231_9FUNG|nr:hypothetical protein HK097_011141 [Rhizophlyctis rosea]
MVYVDSSGKVSAKKPLLRLRTIPETIFAFFSILATFFITLIWPQRTKSGKTGANRFVRDDSGVGGSGGGGRGGSFQGRGYGRGQTADFSGCAGGRCG